MAAIKLEERSGLLAEIVHTILTYVRLVLLYFNSKIIVYSPSTTEEALEDSSNYEYHAAEKLGKEFRDCHTIFPDCDLSPIEKFSRFMTISKNMV